MARSSHRDSRDQRERSLVPVPVPVPAPVPSAAAAAGARASSARDRHLQPIRPDVTVLERAEERLPAETGSARGMLVATLARAAIDLAPDVLRAIDGARTRRAGADSTTSAIVPADRRADPPLLSSAQSSAGGPVYTRSTRVTEREYNLRAPLVRRVVVREATSWESIIPQGSFQSNVASAARHDRTEDEGGHWKVAGLVSLGGALAVAALGVLANRTRN